MGNCHVSEVPAGPRLLTFASVNYAGMLLPWAPHAPPCRSDRRAGVLVGLGAAFRSLSTAPRMPSMPSVEGPRAASDSPMAAGPLAPRSPAWCAMAQRSVLVPARGRWLSLLGVADLEAVVRAVYRTLGQPTPRGLRGQLGREIDLIRGEGEVVGGFTVDDVSRVLAKVGLPLAAQDCPLSLGAFGKGEGRLGDVDDLSSALGGPAARLSLREGTVAGELACSSCGGCL